MNYYDLLIRRSRDTGGGGESTLSFPDSFSVTSCSYNEAAVGQYTKTSEKTTVNGVEYPVYSRYYEILGTTFYVFVCDKFNGASGAYWALNGDSEYSSTMDGNNTLGAVSVGSDGLPSSTTWTAKDNRTSTVSWSVPTPVIPTDYVFYAPLETNETPETGTYITKATRWAFDTAPDGTQCAYNSDYSQGSFSMEAIQYTADIASTDSLTLSIWGYCTRESGVTPPDWLCPISVGDKSGSGFAIEFGHGGNLEVPWVIDATGNGLRPTNNEWHHFAMVYERGGYIKLYVDGVNTWTSSDTKTITIGSNNVYIGGRYNDGRPWVGYLKDAKVYNRVLTDAEIVELATVSWS